MHAGRYMGNGHNPQNLCIIASIKLKLIHFFKKNDGYVVFRLSLAYIKA